MDKASRPREFRIPREGLFTCVRRLRYRSRPRLLRPGPLFSGHRRRWTPLSASSLCYGWIHDELASGPAIHPVFTHKFSSAAKERASSSLVHASTFQRHPPTLFVVFRSQLVNAHNASRAQSTAFTFFIIFLFIFILLNKLRECHCVGMFVGD